MDVRDLLALCLIVLLDHVSLSHSSCDTMKVYSSIQQCGAKHPMPSGGGQPDTSDIAGFCKSLEAARQCTQAAIANCDNEEVKANVNSQLMQYNTLTGAYCSGGCTLMKLQECSMGVKQPQGGKMDEYCRSVTMVKKCMTDILPNCHDNQIKMSVQESLKGIRQQEKQCTNMQGGSGGSGTKMQGSGGSGKQPKSGTTPSAAGVKGTKSTTTPGNGSPTAFQSGFMLIITVIMTGFWSLLKF